MINKQFLPDGQLYVPGILGGLGPLSHTILEQALISACHSYGINKDQNYPLWLLVSGTATPDRTSSLLSDNSSLPYLEYYAQHLEKSGADFIIMACNTAHAYLHLLKKSVSIPFLSIVDSTLNSIHQNNPDIRKVGLMATTGTILSKVYENSYPDYKLEIVTPAPKSAVQKQIMDAIYNGNYGIKATGSSISPIAQAKLLESIDWFRQKGCGTIILGCTEISTALYNNNPEIKLIDPINEVARLAVEICFNPQILHTLHMVKIVN